MTEAEKGPVTVLALSRLQRVSTAFLVLLGAPVVSVLFIVAVLSTQSTTPTLVQKVLLVAVGVLGASATLYGVHYFFAEGFLGVVFEFSEIGLRKIYPSGRTITAEWKDFLEVRQPGCSLVFCHVTIRCPPNRKLQHEIAAIVSRYVGRERVYGRIDSKWDEAAHVLINTKLTYLILAIFFSALILLMFVRLEK